MSKVVWTFDIPQNNTLGYSSVLCHVLIVPAFSFREALAAKIHFKLEDKKTPPKTARERNKVTALVTQ